MDPSLREDSQYMHDNYTPISSVKVSPTVRSPQVPEVKKYVSTVQTVHGLSSLSAAML